MSKKVAAVIVGTTGAVLAGVLGYAAYLNKRYDLDLEHLHEEDDYEDDDEDWLFKCEDTEEDGEGLDECEEDEYPDFDFDSDEPHKGRDTDPFSSKDTPEEFDFAPNNGSMADGFSTRVPFDGTSNFTASGIPMSKESSELWQKFLQARTKDAQNYMNTVTK